MPLDAAAEARVAKRVINRTAFRFPGEKVPARPFMAQTPWTRPGGGRFAADLFSRPDVGKFTSRRRCSRVQTESTDIPKKDILKRLFELHFGRPAERLQQLQGELSGSGRKIIRLAGGN